MEANVEASMISGEDDGGGGEPQFAVNITAEGQLPPTSTPDPAYRLQDYSNPKDAAYFLRVYPALATLVLMKFIPERHTPFPTAHPFLITSVLVYAMAFLTFGILSWTYDRLASSSPPNISPGHYRMLKDTCYILSILAPFLLLPVLFAPLSPSL